MGQNPRNHGRIPSFSSQSRALELVPGLVQHDAHGVGQVEAPDWPVHRDGEAALGMLFEDPGRHALGFAPENQHAVGPEWRLAVVGGRVGREVEAPFARDRVAEGEPVGVDPQVHVIPVVESRALEVAVVDLESERLDEVKWRAGRGAEAGDVAGIGRDLRLDQRHVQCHSTSSGVHLAPWVGPQPVHLVERSPFRQRSSQLRPAVGSLAPVLRDQHGQLVIAGAIS